jgi:hypothetical protein
MTLVAASGDVDRALALADTMTPRARERVLVASAAPDPARVGTVLEWLTDPVRRVEVLLTAGRVDVPGGGRRG